MRSSTASIILAFCASMAVQAVPLASEGRAALINRDIEDNDMELQEANLSKKRSIGGFAYHASSNMLEARTNPGTEANAGTNADESSSDSSDSSDSDSDSDVEEGRPGNRGTNANANSNLSASNPLDANDPANSFDAEDPANSLDAEDPGNSFDAEDPANSFDAEDPANPADAVAPQEAPTDKLTAAVIPEGDDAGGAPKNAADNIVQADAGADEKPDTNVNKPAAANVENLQANAEPVNNNLKTDANSEGDVLKKRDPSPKKKNRKSGKSIKKKFKKTKSGKKFKVKKCKSKHGKTKCK